jgi:hypothetical protein
MSLFRSNFIEPVREFPFFALRGRAGQPGPQAENRGWGETETRWNASIVNQSVGTCHCVQHIPAPRRSYGLAAHGRSSLKSRFFNRFDPFLYHARSGWQEHVNPTRVCSCAERLGRRLGASGSTRCPSERPTGGPHSSNFAQWGSGFVSSLLCCSCTSSPSLGTVARSPAVLTSSFTELRRQRTDGVCSRAYGTDEP